MKKTLLLLLLAISFSSHSQTDLVKKDSSNIKPNLPIFDYTKLPYDIDSLGNKAYYKIDSLGNKLFYTIQIESEFNGGFDGWRKFLVANLNPDAVGDQIKRKDIPKKGLKITAELEFTVCTDGSLCDFKVINNTHPAAKEEALRVIKLSPNWKPGIQNGVFVKSKKRQKITFVVDKD